MSFMQKNKDHFERFVSIALFCAFSSYGLGTLHVLFLVFFSEHFSGQLSGRFDWFMLICFVGPFIIMVMCSVCFFIFLVTFSIALLFLWKKDLFLSYTCLTVMGITTTILCSTFDTVVTVCVVFSVSILTTLFLAIFAPDTFDNEITYYRIL
jgi:hypothetical protein